MSDTPISDELFERSKLDNEIIAGSEVRAAIQEVCHKLSQANETIKTLTDEIEKLRKAENHMVMWCEAYPLDIFPEPDFKAIAKLLKENGYTLDSVSASNMRHVINQMKEAFMKALEVNDE